MASDLVPGVLAGSAAVMQENQCQSIFDNLEFQFLSQFTVSIIVQAYMNLNLSRNSELKLGSLDIGLMQCYNFSILILVSCSLAIWFHRTK